MDKKLIVTLRTPEDTQVVRDTGCTLLAEYPDSLLVRCTEAQRGTLQQAGLEVTELGQPAIRISGASFALSDALEADKAAPIAPDPNRTAYYLVQLVGPAKGEWLGQVGALGGAIHGNLPGFTLLVGILPARLAELQQEPWVEAITPYRPAMKVSHRLRPGVSREFSTTDLATVELAGEEPDAREQVEISIFPGESTATVAAQVRAGGGFVLAETLQSVVAVVPPRVITDLANEEGVQAILPHKFPEFTNDRAAEVMDAPVDGIFAGLTLRGTDQIVAVADSGLDTGDATMVHADFSGRVVSIVSWPNQMGFASNDPPPHDDGAQDANSGHGTHVAGSVLSNGAEATAASFATVPQGIAPEARLYFQAVEQHVNWKTVAQLIADGFSPADIPPWWPPDAIGLHGLPPNLNDLFNPAYTTGARIHTNSWGASLMGLYDASSHQVDEFMWNHRDMLILFAAGNEGVDLNGDGVIDEDSINTPSTAKNCLTVGASENNRRHGSVPTPGLDADWDNLIDPGTGQHPWPQLGAAGHVSDNVDGMAAFSSRGPTDDGRIKPDVVAPGTNVLSTRSSVVGPDPLYGDLAATDPLHGLYCWSGGTSMSTPLVAGAAALIRQHLVQQRGHFQDGVKPSGALVKAFLINGAESISPGQFLADAVGHPPIPASDEIPAEPNNVDGFGRANLRETLIPGRLGMTLFADEPDYAVESGQTRTFEVHVVDTGEPLKVTLVWTDAPGPVNMGGLENKLYLRVRDPGGAIEDGDTTPYPNVTNNVQQVVIAAPAAGAYEIEVRGVSVTEQAPGASPGTNPRQDFALVVSNGMGLSLQPVSIAQAIDTTGSMDYFGYMDPAKERATQLVDFMRINDKVSVTEFSKRPGVPNDARTPYPLRLLGSFAPDWTDAHTAIGGLYSDGRTPIGAGLQEAWNQLSAEPSTRPRAIVLLSDGLNNESPDPFTVLLGIPADVPIFTIALGPAGSETTLRNIADSRPNGGYYTVESDEDVHKLHEIYAQVQALAAGDALVGFASAYAESGSETDHKMSIEHGVKEVTFALSWDPGPGVERMELLVCGPDGKWYDASEAATVERRGTSHHLVRVAVPQPGVWGLKIKNYGSSSPVKYTLSGAVHAPLRLMAGVPKVGEKHLMLVARLRLGDKVWDDARVIARATMPTLSRKVILEEYGDEIRELQLPETVYEEGLSEDQILNLKLAVFAQKFRSKDGGLYDPETFEVEMAPQGDGTWAMELPIAAPGNVGVEILAQGEIEGLPWERRVTQSAYVPEPTAPVRKLYIEDILVRRNKLWGYTIIGARVLHTDGTPAMPRDGVTVSMVLTQGARRVKSGDLLYYRRGGYYLWRLALKRAGVKPGQATVMVQAKLKGVVAATASRSIRL